MSVTGLACKPEDHALYLSWSLSQTSNVAALLIKSRRHGSTVAWTTFQLPATSRTATISNLIDGQEYDVQVVPLLYGSGLQATTGTPQASGTAPTPVAPPAITPAQ